ncbi:hypothetical protein OpiT1DRAFT_03726 [Opitutaceae bacterium TAV1]|nr:hypothetical protein OpiT1DRAFT_03726 [Opitutaceae bacterium TAV1]
MTTSGFARLSRVFLLFLSGGMLTTSAAPVILRTFVEDNYPGPVTFSLPFARASLTTTDNAVIQDGASTPPQQWRALSRWPDGSLQWAQVTCPPPASAATPRTLVLGNNVPRPAVPDAIRITRAPGDAAIELRTGPLTFTLDRATATGRLTLADHPALTFSLSQLVTDDGATLRASIDTLELSETGPLLTVIRATGFHRSADRPRGRGYGRFDVILTLHAGTTHVEIDHALAPLDEDPAKNREHEMQTFRAATLPVRFESLPGAAPGITAESLPLAPGQRLFQHEDNAWTIETANAAAGTRAEGILTATLTSSATAWAAVRDFWQQWPKAFTAAPAGDGFDIDLYPALTLDGHNPYANRQDEQIWYYYLRTGLYEMRQGVEKSHRLFIGWAPAPAAAHTAARALLTLPVILPPLDYLNATQVTDPMLPPLSGGLFDDWDRAFLDAARSWFAQQSGNRWYGLLNWGDWYGERRYNWCNHEYDLPANFFRQALRFQDPVLFREAVREATHLRDIDIVNHHADPARVGLKWKHSVGHTGGYYRPGQDHGMHLPNYGASDAIFLEGSDTPGHTRVASFFLNHQLTGDPRAPEAGRKVTDRLLSHPLLTNPKFNYITSREPGWTLVNLTDAWRATADDRYLAFANRLADNVLAKAAGNGVWLRRLKPHQTGGDVTHGELSFTTAFQATGMIELYKITARPDIKENILTTARYIAGNLYRPEYRAFVHSPSRTRAQTPRAGGLAGMSLRYVLAQACILDPGLTPAFREPILDSFASTVANRQWVGTKQDPDRPYPHDITSAFYWMTPDQAAMSSLFGDELRAPGNRARILSRAAPASIFPPNTARWEDDRIGGD